GGGDHLPTEAETAEPAPAAAGPGEFTRLFLARSAPGQASAGSIAVPSGGTSGGAGEPSRPVIRWVDAGAEPAGDAAGSAAPGGAPVAPGGNADGEGSEPGPGEFTRLFGSVHAPESAPDAGPANDPAAG